MTVSDIDPLIAPVKPEPVRRDWLRVATTPSPGLQVARFRMRTLMAMTDSQLMPGPASADSRA
jgi:hypothetical protein